MIEDLIAAAMNDAARQAEAISEENCKVQTLVWVYHRAYLACSN
jgi:DNA-binding protein YbaB